MTSNLTRRFFALSALCVGVAACADPTPPPQPTMVERGIEASAVVQTVDMSTRQVLLRDNSGRLITFVAGPEVRNLAQVRPGDRVIAEYTEALAVSLAAPGTTAAPSAAVGGVAAAPGQRPGGAIGSEVKVRVRIESVDPAKNAVTFIGPGGVHRTVVARDPGMQEFVRRLRAGQEVDVTFFEAVAVRVEPMR
jgi:hypothetical protein